MLTKYVYSQVLVNAAPYEADPAGVVSAGVEQ
jgi:hypothetical protein